MWGSYKQYDLPKEGSEIGKELVEQADTLGSLGTHTKGTGLAIKTVGVGAGRRALGERLVDKVGVQDSGAVVGETLAELDKGNGPHGPLDLARDAAQGLELLLGGHVRPLAVGGGADLLGGRLLLAGHIDGALAGDGSDATVLGVGQTGLSNGIGVEVRGLRHVDGGGGGVSFFTGS